MAAILMADVVGYSRLMGRDEEGTFDALNILLMSPVNPTIGEFRGRKVKSMGDGFLVTFDSVTRAVECAIAMQNRLHERTAGIEDDKRIQFRIGVHLGELIASEDGDVFGDDVNITARLEALCDPGCVCISSAVHDHVQDQMGEAFADLGAHRFKNIDQPIRVYQHAPERSNEASRPALRPFFDFPAEVRPAHTGGCLCGNIRYEINGPDVGSIYCHCSMCQRFTGAPFMAGTTFKTVDLNLVRGKPKFYHSSDIAKRGFCPDCGSSLFYAGVIGAWTEWILVFTATLDDASGFAPTYHLGIESRQPWLALHDDLPRTRCQDSPSLIDAYGAVGQPVP